MFFGDARHFFAVGQVTHEIPRTRIRESETTIKIKFALFRGGGQGGQRGKLSKTLFFMGNVMTIKF